MNWIIRLLLIFMLMSPNAFASEDCSRLKFIESQHYEGPYGAKDSFADRQGPYNLCRIANALEVIADKIK